MDGIRRRIVVGDLPAGSAHQGNWLASVQARTCGDVGRQLEMVSYLELVIADTNHALPDGTWRDLLRTVLEAELRGELHILDRGGRCVFQCTLGPGPLRPRRGACDYSRKPRFPGAEPPLSGRFRMTFDATSPRAAALARELEAYREYLAWHSAPSQSCEVVVQEGQMDGGYDLIVSREGYVPPPSDSWFVITRPMECRYVGSFTDPTAAILASEILKIVGPATHRHGSTREGVRSAHRAHRLH